MWFNNRKVNVQSQYSYYSIDFDKDRQCIIVPYIMINSVNQISREQFNNVFLNEKECREYLAMHNDLVSLIEKYPVDWDNEKQEKYYIDYDWRFDFLSIDYKNSIRVQGISYVSNRNALKDFINKHEQAIKKFIFCIEEKKFYLRMKGFSPNGNYIAYENASKNVSLVGININHDKIYKGLKTKFTKQEAENLIKEKGLVAESIIFEKVKE